MVNEWFMDCLAWMRCGSVVNEWFMDCLAWMRCGSVVNTLVGGE